MAGDMNVLDARGPKLLEPKAGRGVIILQ